jgi:hypothetical protein
MPLADKSSFGSTNGDVICVAPALAFLSFNCMS